MCWCLMLLYDIIWNYIHICMYVCTICACMQVYMYGYARYVTVRYVGKYVLRLVY